MKGLSDSTVPHTSIIAVKEFKTQGRAHVLIPRTFAPGADWHALSGTFDFGYLDRVVGRTAADDLGPRVVRWIGIELLGIVPLKAGGAWTSETGVPNGRRARRELRQEQPDDNKPGELMKHNDPRLDHNWRRGL
jgi:hypothetical protein